MCVSVMVLHVTGYTVTIPIGVNRGMSAGLIGYDQLTVRLTDTRK